MKTLAIIWAAVLISAVGTFSYVNAQVSNLVAIQPGTSLQQTIDGSELQPASTLVVSTYNPQQTINTSKLQGGQ